MLLIYPIASKSIGLYMNWNALISNFFKCTNPDLCAVSAWNQMFSFQ